jgi:hypothetical protein
VLSEKGPDHRRHERLELGPTQRRQGEGGLKLVVSAEEVHSRPHHRLSSLQTWSTSCCSQ